MIQRSQTLWPIEWCNHFCDTDWGKREIKALWIANKAGNVTLSGFLLGRWQRPCSFKFDSFSLLRNKRQHFEKKCCQWEVNILAHLHRNPRGPRRVSLSGEGTAPGKHYHWRKASCWRMKKAEGTEDGGTSVWVTKCEPRTEMQGWWGYVRQWRVSLEKAGQWNPKALTPKANSEPVNMALTPETIIQCFWPKYQYFFK